MIYITAQHLTLPNKIHFDDMGIFEVESTGNL